MVVQIPMWLKGKGCMCVLLQYKTIAINPCSCPCKQQNWSWWVSCAVCWVYEGHWLQKLQFKTNEFYTYKENSKLWTWDTLKTAQITAVG